MYLVIFGLIMIIAELRWVTLLRYCYCQTQAAADSEAECHSPC